MSTGIDLGRAGDVAKREEEGQTVHIRDVETGEPAFYEGRPVTVRIAGTYSAVYRRTQDAQTQRMITKRQRKLTTDQLLANRIELVAACILGWDGFVQGGKPFPFTPDNARHLLSLAPWIREQLEDAQSDHESFFGSSAGN